MSNNYSCKIQAWQYSFDRSRSPKMHCIQLLVVNNGDKTGCSLTDYIIYLYVKRKSLKVYGNKECNKPKVNVNGMLFRCYIHVCTHSLSLLVPPCSALEPCEVLVGGSSASPMYVSAGLESLPQPRHEYHDQHDRQL